MHFGGCPHPGAMHGRFSVVSAPCGHCGRRWKLSGCLSNGPRPLAEILGGDPRFHHPCICGGEVAFLLPPFVDRLSITVTPPERPGRGFPDRSRPAA
jgi:hypothetical protein